MTEARKAGALQRALCDRQGAVFVEKLIVFLPLMLTFFVAWELAEVTAANLVVQRASAAAGRAAMVVLPDDPLYYGGEPTDSYSGARRADVELAAGMVLSAIPQMSEQFQVEVSDPPSGFGQIDVTVEAPYRCGAVGLICGMDGTLALSAKTTHAYHGARYQYAEPPSGGGGGGVSGSTQALTSRGAGSPKSRGPAADDDVEVSGLSQALGAGDKARSGGGSSSSGGGSSSGSAPSTFTSCGKGNGMAAFTGRLSNTGMHLGTQQVRPYGHSGNSLEALKYRCAMDDRGTQVGLKNVAVIRYQCDGGEEKYVVAQSAAQHSEPEAHKKYMQLVGEAKMRGGGDCEIKEFYTEREPCDDGGCYNFLNKEVFSDLPVASREQKVTYHFMYNPKRSISITKDPYYKPRKAECTKINPQYKAWFPKDTTCNKRKNPRPSECTEIERWARLNGKAGDANVLMCLEYLQAAADFGTKGPRVAYEKQTEAAFKAALDKCPSLDYTAYQ